MEIGNVLQCLALAVLVYTVEAGGPSSDTCKTIVCPPTSTCDDSMGYVSCLCPEGKTGINCTLDDPCLPRLTNCSTGQCFGVCNPNIYCEGATGYAHCRGCILGYKGNDCLEDIDECTSIGGVCQNNATCINTDGSYTCQCTEGWVGKSCDCEKGVECDIDQITTYKTTTSQPGTTTMDKSSTAIKYRTNTETNDLKTTTNKSRTGSGGSKTTTSKTRSTIKDTTSTGTDDKDKPDTRSSRSTAALSMCTSAVLWASLSCLALLNQ